MNKFFIQKALLVLGLGLLLNTNALAESETVDPDPITDPVITLSGEVVDGYAVLEWKTEHESPHGFKVVRSYETDQPVYPDDNPHYYGSDGHMHKDWDMKAGKTYHYRVCAYTGSGCDFYSNTVTLTIDQDPALCTTDSRPVCGVDGVTYEGNRCGSDPLEVKIAYKAPCIGDPAYPNYIWLEAEVKDGLVYLEWSSENGTPRGVKVVRSEVHENPVYPAMNGDLAKYLAKGSSYRDYNVKGGHTYHYRICEYNGNGACETYSETMTLTLPDDFVSVKERKFDIHKKHRKEELKKHNGQKEGLKDELAELKAELKRLKSELKQVRKELHDIRQHRYKAAIEYLADNKVVQGYDDGTFKPDNTVNRAEFLKMVIAAQFGEELSEEDHSCFEDVEGQWFAPYVCLAKHKGIVSGYDDGTFKPSQEINFVEAAKIVNQVYGLKGKTKKGGKWYEDYVQKLQDKKFIPPTVKKLEKKLSRAEMAEILWRIKENKQDQEAEDLIE